MKALMVGVSLMTGLLWVSAASAGGHMKGGHHRGDRQLERLDLNDKQKEQIKALREAHRAEMKAQRKEMKGLQKDFRAKMKSSASDEELRTAFKKIQDHKRGFEDSRFENSLKIRAQLTEEQRAKYRIFAGDKRKERRGKRSERNYSEKD